MPIDRNPEIVASSLTRDVLGAVRYYLGGRTGLIAVAAAALGLGAYLGWGWLVAAGVAPLLLAVLPCAAMCALGLCMGGMPKRHSGEEEPSSDNDKISTPEGTLPASPPRAIKRTVTDNPTERRPR